MLLAPQKHALRVRRFADDDDGLKQQIVLSDRHTAFRAKMEKSVLIVMETMWKNNFVFVKDEPMIYVDCIIVAVIVSEEKRRHYFRITPRINA
jgi:hypothetical protein